MYYMIYHGYTHPEIGHYQTYGIQMEHKGIRNTIYDISTCQEHVSRMVDIFNRLRLNPIHFKDAIEDFIA